MKLGLFSWMDLLKRNRELCVLAEEHDVLEGEIQEVYLKRMALDICANFVARAAAQSEFKTDNKEWYYKLNVRPNTDASAAQFWETFFYRLIVDNRVLVVLSDSDDLLIADTWVRDELAIYEDTFESVVVKGYQFKRKFKMNEVIYLEYNNEKLERFTNGLFKDYSQLYTRMLEAAKRNNQIRGTVALEANKEMNDETRNQLQNYIDKLFQAFKNRSIAIAPLMKGFSYQEYSNTATKSNISVDEITKVPNYLIDTVADALGIPTALLHGNRAELKDNILAFYKFCLPAFLKKIQDELNAKTIDKKDYMNGERIEVVGINRPNIFELAESIAKLIESSTFNTNELRKELGYDPREGGDEYVRTKNYEPTTEKGQKGGEKN